VIFDPQIHEYAPNGSLTGYSIRVRIELFMPGIPPIAFARNPVSLNDSIKNKTTPGVGNIY
jgi:hypothetical protein